MVWRYRPSGGTSAGLSGRTGNRSVLGRAHDGLGGGPIYAIEMGERNDKPCYMKVFYSWQNAQYRASKEFDVCGSAGPTSSSRERIGAATPAQGTRVPALRSLRVCSNDRNGANYRVKGLRLGRARVTESGEGSVQALPGNDYLFSRSNCREWEQTRTCPANQVIIAIDVHYTLENGRGAISGLTPHCGAPSHEEMQSDTCRPGGC